MRRFALVIVTAILLDTVLYQLLSQESIGRYVSNQMEVFQYRAQKEIFNSNKWIENMYIYVG